MRILLIVFVWCFALGAAQAASMPEGFLPSDLNASIPPVYKDGEVTFRIVPKDCGEADYDNGGTGEND